MILSIPHWWCHYHHDITVILLRVSVSAITLTPVVPLMEQELVTFPEHMCSPPSKKNRQHNGKMYKRTNNVLQNMHIRLQIEKHESHYEPKMDTGAPERYEIIKKKYYI